MIAAGALPAAAQTPFPCVQPGPTTQGKAWKKPSYPQVLPRKAAWSLADTDANVDKLRRAYKAMQALPASNPHSMAAQRNMHAWYCNDCGSIDTHQEIHGSYDFFPWHRAFLYFHERILGKLINDFTLRLTYFNWEVVANRATPPIFAKAAQPLWHKRALPAAAPVYPAVIFNAVHNDIGLGVDDFFGTATAGGTPEGRPHNNGHVAIGDDMGVLNTAAGDPIFYCHHGNVDRMWSSWQAQNPGKQPGGGFSSLRFSFWDENKQWVSVGVADLADTKILGYTYDSLIAPPLRRVTANVPIALLQASKIGPPPPPDRLKDAQTVDVRLEQLVVPSDEGIFLVQAVTADGASHDLGTFASIPHIAGAMKHRDLRAINLALPVPVATARLIARSGTTFKIVRRSARGRSPNFSLGTGVAQVTTARIGALSLDVR
jgi:hypothetical protein